jgi:hypothetical protein
MSRSKVGPVCEQGDNGGWHAVVLESAGIIIGWNGSIKDRIKRRLEFGVIQHTVALSITDRADSREKV